MYIQKMHRFDRLFKLDDIDYVHKISNRIKSRIRKDDPVHIKMIYIKDYLK